MKSGFWRADWFLGVGVVVLFAIFSQTSDLIPSLERKAYDLGVAATTRTPSDRIAIIAIDEASLANIGRWPWSRDVMATMTDRRVRHVPVTVGGSPVGDLLLVQGPIGLNWRDRRKGVIPRVENADIRANYPPTPGRVDGWVDTGIHVDGRPEWIFIKIHTHGAPEKDAAVVLGPAVDEMFSHLETAYNDGERFVLHYVTARETYNIIKAAEAGKTGNPNQYRDFVLPPPQHRVAPTVRPSEAAA